MIRLGMHGDSGRHELWVLALAGNTGPQEFKTSGALSGFWSDFRPGTGIAGQEVIDNLPPNGGFRAFYILSYSTPIAWYTEAHGWTIPRAKYSVTTTGHQNAIRGTLARENISYTEV